ncbi:hypothetical protein OQA88_10159 [Cercophora sp. LCS_1]
MAAQGITKDSERLEWNNTLSTHTRGGLEKRQQLDCGFGDWIQDWFYCWEGYDYLKKLGTALCGARSNTCSRVSCSRGCGMFLCSHLNREVQVYCGDIANDMAIIADRCGDEWFTFWRVKGRLGFGGHSTHLTSQSC